MEKLTPRDADAVRKAKQRVVAFSPAIAEANQVIKDFLGARMYRHWRVNRMTTKARVLTTELFRLLHADAFSCCPTTGEPGEAREEPNVRRAWWVTISQG